MQPAEALQRARQQAHANLRAQAAERVHSSLQGLQGAHSNFLQGAHSNFRQPAVTSPFQNTTMTAPELRSLGMNQQAAQLFEARHPAAMEGRANMPDWVVNQMARQLGPLAHEARGGLSQDINPGGPERILPRLPESPMQHAAQPLLAHGLLHLGQGLFLHPGTGEIHGFGPTGAVLGHPESVGPGAGGPIGPIHPGPVAF